jgi:uncharacterized protein involved in copper resistance
MRNMTIGIVARAAGVRTRGTEDNENSLRFVAGIRAWF